MTEQWLRPPIHCHIKLQLSVCERAGGQQQWANPGAKSSLHKTEVWHYIVWLTNTASNGTSSRLNQYQACLYPFRKPLWALLFVLDLTSISYRTLFLMERPFHCDTQRHPLLYIYFLKSTDNRVSNIVSVHDGRWWFNDLWYSLCEACGWDLCGSSSTLI